MASSCTERVFAFLNRFKYVVVAVWLIISFCSAFFALGLFDETTFYFDPPEGYPSYTAYQKMNEYFPALLNEDVEIIVIELKTHSYLKNIDNNITESLCNDINQSIYNLNNALLSSLQYFYSCKNQNISAALCNTLKPKFIDPAATTMLFLITLDLSDAETKGVNAFLNPTKSILEELLRSNVTYSANYNVHLTGMMTMIEECVSTLTKDVISKDLMIIPVIFVVMVFVVGSYKLIFLPFLCFAMATSISFVVFRYFASADWFIVGPENPSFMLFVTMAICVDYGLFLLTRFINAIQLKKLDTNDAIKDMLQYSGHVIVLSGSILVSLEIGFGLFFPYAGIDAACYGIALCVFLSIIISISFTTCVILIFPSYFSEIERVPKFVLSIKHKLSVYCGAGNRKQNERKDVSVNSNNSNSVRQPMLIGSKDEESVIKQEDDASDEEHKEENAYFKLAQIVTRPPWQCVFPLLIYLSMLFFIYQLFANYKTTMSPDMMFPTNSDSVDAYDTVRHNFNPGLVSPFYVLAVPRNHHKNTVWDQTYFNDICQFANALMHRGYTNNSDMMSFTFISDASDPQKINCFQNESTVHQMVHNPHTNPLYLQSYHMTVNPQQNASLIVLYPTFDVYGSTAQSHATDWRDFITSFDESCDSMDLYVHSSTYWQIDLLQLEYDRMPLCLVVMLLLISIIIGVAYKSLVLPSQLLFCIVIPIMFVYGCCVCVYNEGWLNWTNINGYTGLSDSNGLFWMTPVLSFSLLLGLALDYEIFLLSRIYEYRSKHGYTSTASIILALARTGPVISSAGIVMTLAFGGLLLETVPTCDQFGFIFVVGVLVDTFVIRPILVPAVLSFGDNWNWYPTVMPSENLKNEYHKVVRTVSNENVQN